MRKFEETVVKGPSAETSRIPACGAPPALNEPQSLYVSVIATISAMTKANIADVPKFRSSCRTPHMIPAPVGQEPLRLRNVIYPTGKRSALSKQSF